MKKKPETLRQIHKICDVCGQPPDQPCVYTREEDPQLTGKRRPASHLQPSLECSTSTDA
jgi:hypothetical protein